MNRIERTANRSKLPQWALGGALSLLLGLTPAYGAGKHDHEHANDLKDEPSTASPGSATTVGKNVKPEVLFKEFCSVCHGENGDGNSRAKRSLDPSPADFTSAQKQQELSRAHMIETVKKGSRTKDGRPTAMVSWTRQLSAQQIESVVDYVIVRFMGGLVLPDDAHAPDDPKHQGHDHGQSQAVEYPYGLQAEVARGKTLFATHCANCHGTYGEGKSTPQLGSTHRTRDFRSDKYRAAVSGMTMYSAISYSPTHKPPFDGVLSNQDIADIAEYAVEGLARLPAPAEASAAAQ